MTPTAASRVQMLEPNYGHRLVFYGHKCCSEVYHYIARFDEQVRGTVVIAIH